MPNALAGLTPYAQVGILPGASSARPGYTEHPSGAALPATTPGAGSTNVGKPWSPDSPIFWVGVLVAAAIGLVGASFKVHAGPAHAGASIGK